MLIYVNIVTCTIIPRIALAVSGTTTSWLSGRQNAIIEVVGHVRSWASVFVVLFHSRATTRTKHQLTINCLPIPALPVLIRRHIAQHLPWTENLPRLTVAMLLKGCQLLLPSCSRASEYHRHFAQTVFNRRSRVRTLVPRLHGATPTS